MKPTSNPTQIGPNRTGVGASPIDSKKTAEGAVAGTPNATYDTQALEKYRQEYSTNAPPVGRMPPPSSIKGIAKTGVDALKGSDVTVLLDLLGERLAFERTGTRLYEALLVKYEAASVHPGGPSRAQLEKIRDEELRHFGLLTRAFEKLGADPTSMTPSADIAGVASMGLVQVLGDPRTTFTEGLKTILIAELADNDGWELLSDLSARMGHDDLAAEFRQALLEEQEHLRLVRDWVSRTVEGQAKIAPKTTAAKPPAGPDVRH